LLGPHQVDTLQRRWVIRASIRPRISAAIRFLDFAYVIEATKLPPYGFFEARFRNSARSTPRTPHLSASISLSPPRNLRAFDTYAFPFSSVEFDLYLDCEGRHYDTYNKLGAQHSNSRRSPRRHFAGLGAHGPASQRRRDFIIGTAV